MDKVRVGLFFRDLEVTKENLEKAKKLIEDVRGLPGQVFQRRVLGWGGGSVVDCRTSISCFGRLVDCFTDD